jgi:hypothetical protein
LSIDWFTRLAQDVRKSSQPDIGLATFWGGSAMRKPFTTIATIALSAAAILSLVLTASNGLMPGPGV